MDKRTVVMAAALGLAGCGGGRPAAPAVAFEARARAVPAGAEAADPQIAMSDSDTLYLLATEGEGAQARLVLAASHDGGDTFGPPLAASDPGAALMSRGEMAPVLRVAGGNAYALWEQSRAAGPTEILVARSADGRAFGKPVEVVKNAKPDFRGFANLSQPAGKTLYAVWLDGRDARRPQGTFDVYLSRSDDQGATWGGDVAVGAGGCPCCRPAVAADGKGNVYVAWRKVYPGDQRDLALSISHDGGRTFAAPVRVAGEGWTLHACPESGPAVALRGDGAVVVAWFSGAGHPGVRVATSRDGGRTFRVAEVGAAVADQNHPRLAVSPDGGVWLTLQGRAATAKDVFPPLAAFVARVGEDGTLGATEAAGGGSILGYPQIAAGGGGRIFVASGSEVMGQRRVELIRGRAAAGQ